MPNSWLTEVANQGLFPERHILVLRLEGCSSSTRSWCWSCAHKQSNDYLKYFVCVFFQSLNFRVLTHRLKYLPQTYKKKHTFFCNKEGEMYPRERWYQVNAGHFNGLPRCSKYFIEEKKEVKVGIGSSSKVTFVNKKKIITVKALSLIGSTI